MRQKSQSTPSSPQQPSSPQEPLSPQEPSSQLRRTRPPKPIPQPIRDPNGQDSAELPLLTPTSIQTSKYCGLCRPQQKTYHLRLAGPSMSGKTGLVRYLLHGQYADTAPTNEMEVSRVYWSTTPFILWDSRKFPEDDNKSAVAVTPNLSLSHNRLLIAQRQQMDALIYVVDASDKGRLKIASRDFERLVKTYHNVPVVLVLGSKSDSPSTVDVVDIKEQLKILQMAYDRECEVFLVSALTGKGIDEAFNWLCHHVKQKEGFWSTFFEFFNFQGSRDQGTISCGRFGSWDPLSLCRYSRLS